MAINRDKILQEAQKHVDKKRYDKAIAELQKVVADDPTDVRTWLKIGDLHLRLDQFAEAITTYERVGNYYSDQGFSVKAVAVYKQIREIIHKHAPHLEDRFGHIVPRLADLLTQLDLRSDALAYYDEMATRMQRLGRERDAIDVFRKIVGLDPQNPVSHLRLADAFTRVRDFDSAVVQYAEASEILTRIGRKDDALRVLERLLTHRPLPEFARKAAEIHLERNTQAEAMAALAKLQIAFKDNPRDLPTLELLSRAFDGLGQPSKAVEVMKEAARIAREGQNRDEFARLVSVLLQRAPNDETVRQLAQLSVSPGPASVLPQSMPPQAIQPQSMPLQGVPQQAPVPPPADSEREISVVEDLSDDIEFVDDDLDAVVDEDEPLPLRASYPPDDESAVLRQVLARAEAMRRQADYQNAAIYLRDAISRQPGVRELRERLCDVLIEAGEQEQAIVEMLAFAQLLADAQDADSAARLLDEVLLLDPENRPALALLHAMGYAVPVAESAAPTPPPPAPSGYDPLAPLPSYDLEDLTADELPLSQAQDPHGFTGPQPAYRPPAASAPMIELDDPFSDQYPTGHVQTGHVQTGHVQAGHVQAAPPTGFGQPELPPYEQPAPSSRSFGATGHDEATSIGQALPSYPIDDEAPARPSLTGLDEAALEEIEFFQAQGMLDEAENLLAEQLSRLPNHPLLLDRKRELQMARAAVGAGGPASLGPQSATQELTGDRAFDIARALEGLDEFDQPAAETTSLGHQVSVEAVFEQFKAGIAAQISENDSATHYDLGVAYKEMGLHADAIAEFQLAARDPLRECVCESMIGMMHMEQNNLEAAIDSFLMGLHAGAKTPDQELALTYEIGNAYEMRGSPEQALYYFQLVARLDPSYRDPRGSTAERIAALERVLNHNQPVAPKAVAIGAGTGDEFDAAFDDLFNPKD